MTVTLHERGLIERVPGQPRITLRLPPDALPPFQSIKISATGYERSSFSNSALKIVPSN